MKNKNIILASFTGIIIFSILSSGVSSVLTSFDYYQFVTDTRIKADGWTFDLTVKDANWSSPPAGLILTYKYYHLDNLSSINYISPVDILIGTGIVASNPDKYDFKFSWGDRYVNVSFTATPTEIPEVLENIGNIHCIARNQDSLSMLKSIQNRTLIRLSGYLVDVAGWNVTNTLLWETDTEFGNEDCEILVISDVIPVDVSINDIYFIIFLLIIVIVSISVIFILHQREKRACNIEQHRKISGNL